MPVRLRKFIGTILIIVLVLVYALVANTIAVATLGSAPWWGHLLYFPAHRPALDLAGDGDHQMDGRTAAAVSH